MTRILWLFLAGGVGTLARYGLAGAVQRWWAGDYPWGTVAVNLLGCLLFGLVWSLSEHRQLITAETRLIILTGFMGAFTTFSTFAFDTGRLLNGTDWLYAVGNLVMQNGVGIAAIFAGMALAKLF